MPYESVLLEEGQNININAKISILYNNKLLKDLPIIAIGNFEECTNASCILKRQKYDQNPATERQYESVN